MFKTRATAKNQRGEMTDETVKTTTLVHVSLVSLCPNTFNGHRQGLFCIAAAECVEGLLILL